MAGGLQPCGGRGVVVGGCSGGWGGRGCSGTAGAAQGRLSAALGVRRYLLLIRKRQAGREQGPDCPGHLPLPSSEQVPPCRGCTGHAGGRPDNAVLLVPLSQPRALQAPPAHRLRDRTWPRPAASVLFVALTTEGGTKLCEDTCEEGSRCARGSRCHSPASAPSPPHCCSCGSECGPGSAKASQAAGRLQGQGGLQRPLGPGGPAPAPAEGTPLPGEAAAAARRHSVGGGTAEPRTQAHLVSPTLPDAPRRKPPPTHTPASAPPSMTVLTSERRSPVHSWQGLSAGQGARLLPQLPSQRTGGRSLPESWREAPGGLVPERRDLHTSTGVCTRSPAQRGHALGQPRAAAQTGCA